MSPRHTTYRRAVAWLLLGLFCLVVAEPLRVHVCPMHDGASVLALFDAGAHHAGQQATSAPHHEHDAGDAASRAASHGTAHDGSTDDQQAAGAPSPHACQCVGACCTAAPVTAPSSVSVAVLATFAATAVVAPAVPVGVAAAGDVVLPFAIGPPAV